MRNGEGPLRENWVPVWVPDDSVPVDDGPSGVDDGRDLRRNQGCYTTGARLPRFLGPTGRPTWTVLEALSGCDRQWSTYTKCQTCDCPRDPSSLPKDLSKGQGSPEGKTRLDVGLVCGRRRRHVVSTHPTVVLCRLYPGFDPHRPTGEDLAPPSALGLGAYVGTDWS